MAKPPSKCDSTDSKGKPIDSPGMGPRGVTPYGLGTRVNTHTDIDLPSEPPKVCVTPRPSGGFAEWLDGFH